MRRIVYGGLPWIISWICFGVLQRQADLIFSEFGTALPSAGPFALSPLCLLALIVFGVLVVAVLMVRRASAGLCFAISLSLALIFTTIASLPIAMGMVSLMQNLS